MIKINRLSTKGGKIYLSTYDGRVRNYISKVSQTLSKIYGDTQDMDGVYAEIIKQVVDGKIQLVGRQGHVGHLREVIESLDEDDLKGINSTTAGALVDTIEQDIRPTAKPWVIKMRQGEILAGCYSFQVGDEPIELIPYSTAEITEAKPKFFLTKDMAKAYIEKLREKCPNFAGYGCRLEQRTNNYDFEGVAKIWKRLQGEDIELRHTKSEYDSTGKLTKYYQFTAKPYIRLIMTKKSKTATVYRLERNNKLIYEDTNQLRVCNEVLKLFKKKNQEKDNEDTND